MTVQGTDVFIVGIAKQEESKQLRQRKKHEGSKVDSFFDHLEDIYDRQENGEDFFSNQSKPKEEKTIVLKL